MPYFDANLLHHRYINARAAPRCAAAAESKRNPAHGFWSAKLRPNHTNRLDPILMAMAQENRPAQVWGEIPWQSPSRRLDKRKVPNGGTG
ncbi:MAG: hypothetical protein EBU97_03340 [Rhodobacteraceae bacterium]|nr:hypothetical protein [Paracoccaceae bacterium]